QLQRVRRPGAGLDDSQPDPVPAVGAGAHGGVDGRVRGIGREVEREPDDRRSVPAGAPSTPACERDQRAEQRQGKPHGTRSYRPRIALSCPTASTSGEGGNKWKLSPSVRRGPTRFLRIPSTPTWNAAPPRTSRSS